MSNVAGGWTLQSGTMAHAGRANWSVANVDGEVIEWVRARTDKGVGSTTYRYRTASYAFEFCAEESGDPTKFDPEKVVFDFGAAFRTLHLSKLDADDLARRIVEGVKTLVRSVSSGRVSYDKSKIVIQH